MAITYHSGRRIQATSTDFGTAGAGIPAVSGGWKELARTTLGSANSSLSNLGFADKRYYMFLISTKGQNAAATNNFFRAGSSGSLDTGSNYAGRHNTNGTGDGTVASVSSMICPISSATDVFQVHYAANLAGKEKLFMSWKNEPIATGAGQNPYRQEFAWKHAQTSNPLDSFELNTGGGNTYNIGSELVVLGWDPADTHTDNFWEELASVSASGSSTNLSSGTITAKKYLWVQCYSEGTSGDINVTLNNDTGANYARRNQIDGGADTTSTSATSWNNVHNAGRSGEEAFSNWFIINNSANEKLGICHSIQQNTAGAANAPARMETVTKWANTSAQITEIDFDAGGNFGTNSILKVWGSD